MSKEIIVDLIYDLTHTDKEDFCKHLTAIMEYGFAEDLKVAELLDIDLSEVDELMSSSDELTDRTWQQYVKKLVKYLNKERKRYETLYYSNK